LVYQIDDVKGLYYFDGTNWLRLLDISKDGNPIGIIISFSTQNVPNGYLECNGQGVSRTTYANLFNVIGTIYGAGDGSTTFNLPDYRGQFLRGYDNGAGTDPNATTRIDRGDGTTGDAVGTKQSSQFKSHQRTINPPATNTSTNGNHNHTIDPPNTATTINGNHRHRLATYNSSNSGFNRQRNARGRAHNTRQYTEYAGNHHHTVNIAPFASASAGCHNHTLNIAPFNSDISGGQESRPTNISVMYCIKF
jgi:microcystin-dependent protein